EEMDNRLRGAANNEMPAYDDRTWGGMKVLLDQHLPQKRKRRGIILFALVGLLLVTSGILLIAKFSAADHPVTEQKQQPAITTAAPSIKATVSQNNNPEAETVVKNSTTASPVNN